MGVLGRHQTGWMLCGGHDGVPRPSAIQTEPKESKRIFGQVEQAVSGIRRGCQHLFVSIQEEFRAATGIRATMDGRLCQSHPSGRYRYEIGSGVGTSSGRERKID